MPGDSASAESGASFGANELIGAVQTVAGPGFCSGAAKIDKGSIALRALAVDESGLVHAETASPDEGLIVKVDGEGRTRLLRASGEAGPQGNDTVDRSKGSGPQYRSSKQPAGRLASDRNGGIFVANEDQILQVNVGVSRVTFVDNADTGRGLEDVSGAAVQGLRRPPVFRSILSIATDAAGNIFVAESTDPRVGAFRIRFLNRSQQPSVFYGGTPAEITVAPGAIATIAGEKRDERTPDQSAAGTGYSAFAELRGEGPVMAVAKTGLYLAFRRGAARRAKTEIRLINLGPAPIQAHGALALPAAMTTVVTDYENRSERGTGIRARPARITGVAADSRGNLYLADQLRNVVLRLDDAGRLDRFAGTGRAGFNGNDRPASQAYLNGPFGVAMGPHEWVYISDGLNGQLRYVDESGQIRASAGSGAGRRWICHSDARKIRSGSQERSRAGLPIGVAVDRAGNLYVSTALLGLKKFSASGDAATLTQTNLRFPATLATGKKDGLYVFNAEDSRIVFANFGRRSVRVHGVVVPAGAARPVAGNGKKSGPGVGVRALEAPLSGGSILAADSRGNLFVGDSDNGVRRIDPEGRINNALEAQALSSGCCRSPSGLAVDANDSLYVADRLTNRVWFVNVGSSPIIVYGQRVGAYEARPVAGSGERGFEGDGDAALAAKFQSVGSIALDRGGTLYVVDYEENTVRAVNRLGVIETAMGTGGNAELGFNGDGRKGQLTSLHQPGAIAVDGCGNVFVADQENDRIRLLNVKGACRPARG